jgi:hypothetical protein
LIILTLCIYSRTIQATKAKIEGEGMGEGTAPEKTREKAAEQNRC